MREGWNIWGGTGAPSPQGEGGYLAAELVAVLLPAVPCVAVTYLPVHEEPVVLFRFGLCVALHVTYSNDDRWNSLSCSSSNKPMTYTYHVK
jgi:hypothetical protein